MTQRPNGGAPAERVLCRPRTAVLALLAAALLVAVALLKGTESRQPPETPPSPAPPPSSRVAERPADARPADPRRRSAEQRPAVPKRLPVAETRRREDLAVRVVDTAGRARSGVPVELVSGDAGANPGRPLDAVRISDGGGAIRFQWPKAGEASALLSAAMVLEEPLVLPVTPSSAEPVTLTIPESGEVVVAIVDEAGRPFAQPAAVQLLVAANDPWPGAVALERASRAAVGGTARIPLVEAGTLLLVEGRTPDRGFAIAPKLIEGPASEGAVVETTLVARRRPAAETAPAGGPRFVAPGQGPPASTTPAPAKGSPIRLSIQPRDALPQWPLVLQAGLKARGSASLAASARVDARASATLGVPAGRYEPACRLWRAMPDGWLTADVELAAPGQPAIEAGRRSAAEIAIDARSLAATAAALTAW
jgi:hypothetical protein